jgi:hypothetical protein
MSKEVAMGNEAMEAPKSLAVGQRWRGRLTGKAFTIVAVGVGTHTSKYDDGDTICGGGGTGGGDFLGWAPGFGPTPALGVPAVMGEVYTSGRVAHPAACLSCGGERSGAMYHCAPCLVSVGLSDRMALCESWRFGARDFPRPAPATPQPEAPRGVTVTFTPTTCRHGMVGLCAPCNEDARIEAEHKRLFPPRIPASRPLPAQHLTHGHRFEVCEKLPNGEWQALSALQVIKARKPPEPWVPSIDEYDLLPDAGR